MTDRELLELMLARVDALTVTVEEMRAQVDGLAAWADSLMDAKEGQGSMAKRVN